MSDKDDDAQAPTTSGAKPKKKTSNENADKSKEQTSSDTKKVVEKKASILKTENSANEEKKKKKSVKIDSPEPSAPRRGFSDQKSSSRYRMAQHSNRTQRSHSIANVVPRREAAKRPQAAVSTLSYSYEVPSSDRDHHSALEFLEKSSPFTARESLLDLRKRDAKEKFRQHHHHHKKDGGVKRHVHHTKRCRECLEIEGECECSLAPVTVRLSSDWGFLVKPDIAPIRTWTNPRLDWLEELEEASEGALDQAEEKFTKEDEICCFPFSTFNIFKKKELKTLDFYTKN